MQTDLESALAELSKHAEIDVVLVGDDVERRAEAPALLEVRDVHRAAQPCSGFDVMREDERGVVAVRPEPGELGLVDVRCLEQASRREPHELVDRTLERPRGKLRR